MLHLELCQKNTMSMDELEKLFRSVIRSEGRALLREWGTTAPVKVATESRSDDDDEDDDDDDSLDMATAFCGNLA